MTAPLPELTAEKARIFRITHVDNIEWLLRDGVHCRRSTVVDPNFVAIGNVDLIEKRHHRRVPHALGGTLSNYVPFYFTPKSMMAFNIFTGYRVKQRPNKDIAVLVSSLHQLANDNVPFLFTDRHASLEEAQFFDEIDDLKRLDWNILRAVDFKRDNDNPEKTDRYQAEALVRDRLPTESIIGIACYNDEATRRVARLVEDQDLQIKCATKRSWYF